MSYAPQPSSTIEIKTSYFFLAFLLFFFKPKASIDGSAPIDLQWGTNPIPGPPGRHSVDVWVPYLFYRFMGRSSIVVDVPPGGAVQVRWKAPLLVFLKGAISAGPAEGSPPLVDPAVGYPPVGASPFTVPAPAAVASAAPAGWHADPAGRHEQRYYDGQAWTEHVVDAGVQSADPLGS